MRHTGGLAGSYLPLPQINLRLVGLLFSCHSILLFGISHRRKRIVIEACVREEIHFCVLFLWFRERGGLLQIAIQSREHIWMTNCPHKGLMHLLFYRGTFSQGYPQAWSRCASCPCGAHHASCCLLDGFCAKFPFAQGCTQCPAVPGSGCPFSWLFAES